MAMLSLEQLTKPSHDILRLLCNLQGIVYYGPIIRLCHLTILVSILFPWNRGYARAKAGILFDFLQGITIHGRTR